MDTNVIVAALLAWHEHHPRASSALREALTDADVVIPAPALVEAFSVMTRLPAPHRLSPRDTHTLLQDNFRDQARVVSLDARGLWRWLGGWADQGVSGGRTFDAHIVACAREAGAASVLTFNTRDFQALVGDDLDVVAP